MNIFSTPFRYLLTPSIQKGVQNKINSLNWEEMEKSPSIPEIDDSEFCVRIPGGGITKTLYDEGWVCLPVYSFFLCLIYKWKIIERECQIAYWNFENIFIQYVLYYIHGEDWSLVIGGLVPKKPYLMLYEYVWHVRDPDTYFIQLLQSIFFYCGKTYITLI